jgi:hypothetical protein
MVNDALKSVWKDMVVTQLGYASGIYLVTPRSTTKSLS